MRDDGHEPDRAYDQRPERIPINPVHLGSYLVRRSLRLLATKSSRCAGTGAPSISQRHWISSATFLEMSAVQCSSVLKAKMPTGLEKRADIRSVTTESRSGRSTAF